jgi:hypothetical protein
MTHPAHESREPRSHRRPGLASTSFRAYVPRHYGGAPRGAPKHRAELPVDSSPVTAWPKHRATR